MRIYLSGDEDTCKWHLPVIESMLHNWVSLCRREGIKQNTFHHIFEDTGTEVHAQYIFGQTSVQIHSPIKKATYTKKQEESKVDLSCPRTFYIETVKGFFWVIVRRDVDGKPVVALEKFQAMTGDILKPEYIYPAMGQQTAGIVAGVVDEKRFIITQKAGVFAGDCERKGSLVLPPAAEDGRITVADIIAAEKQYFVISGNYESRRVSNIKVKSGTTETGVQVELKYAEANVPLDTDASRITAETLMPNPCWVHRKCSGSYFSPQKTIGFHVDIGTDDARLGNVTAVYSNAQDKLDPVFNHTEDLYRFCDVLNIPISISGDVVRVAVVSMTMGYSLVPPNTIPWGGYGWNYGAACADYRQDFTEWMLAPRVVFADIDTAAGTVSYEDQNGNVLVDVGARTDVEIMTWDGKFSGRFIYESSIAVDTKRYYSDEYKEVDNCSWTETVAGRCDYNDDVGYSGELAKERNIYRPLIDYGRENLRNRRLLYFIAGKQQPTKKTANITGMYHLFEGLFHLDIGVMWTFSQIVGEQCAICSVPLFSQEPGGYVWFYVNGPIDAMQDGHEYVENLEVITPLGFHPIGGVEMFGFKAKVPESYAAPHEPVVLVGGVEYRSENIGEVVRCEHALMSSPCICVEGGGMSWSEDSVLTLSGGSLQFSGGCPPFTWTVSGGFFVEPGTGKNLGNILRKSTVTFLQVVVTNACEIRASVVDACGDKIEKEAEYVNPVGVVSGAPVLSPGQLAYYSHNLGAGATYTGDLDLVENGVGGAYVKAPGGSGGGVYSVSFRTYKCGGVTASMAVGVGEYCPYPTYGNGSGGPGVRFSIGAGTVCMQSETFGNSHTCLSGNDCPASPSDTWISTYCSPPPGVQVGDLIPATLGVSLRCPMSMLVYNQHECRRSSQAYGEPGMCGWQARVIWIKQ